MTDRLDEHLLPAPLAPARWSVFDPAWYSRVSGQTGDYAALRAHWLADGQPAGLSPVRWFDEAWYRATYPDIAAAIAAGTWRSGFEQYCLLGHADRSPHPLFDDALYAATTQGLNDTTLRASGCFNRYDHFLAYGAAAGLTGHALFDPLAYAEAAGIEPAAAFGHYLDALLFAAVEPAPSPLFDPAWYRAAQPFAEAAIATGRFHRAILHYLGNDTPTEFDPLPDFVEAHYLAQNPAVAAMVEAGVFRNGYAHFLAHGAAALRPPAPWIDLAAIAARHPEAAGDPFRFLLTAGQAELPSGAADAATRAALPLLSRGRLDFTPTAPAALAAIVVVPSDRAEALPALEAVHAAAPGAVELLLLDQNGQAGGLAALAGGARVLPLARDGLAAALNAALAACTAPALLLLDGAAVPSAAALRAGLARLAADPSAAILGGPVTGANGTLLEAGSIVAPDFAIRAYLRRAPAQVSEAGFLREVDGFFPIQVLLRRAPISELGGFDAQAPDRACVMELCLRVWQAGQRVLYDPALAVALPGARALRVAAVASPPPPRWPPGMPPTSPAPAAPAAPNTPRAAPAPACKACCWSPPPCRAPASPPPNAPPPWPRPARRSRSIRSTAVRSTPRPCRGSCPRRWRSSAVRARQACPPSSPIAAKATSAGSRLSRSPSCLRLPPRPSGGGSCAG